MDGVDGFFKVNGAENYQDVYFLYECGVGLFPSVLDGGTMKMHAVINQGCRGKIAVDAGKKAVTWVFENTDAKRIETKADKKKKHLLFFNSLILERFKEDQDYIYYEVSR